MGRKHTKQGSCIGQNNGVIFLLQTCGQKSNVNEIVAGLMLLGERIEHIVHAQCNWSLSERELGRGNVKAMQID